MRHHGPQAWWPAESRFEVMVGAVLVQQTAWVNASRAIDRLRDAGLLDHDALASAPRSTVEGLIRAAGFYRVKAKRLVGLARFVSRAGGLSMLQQLGISELRAALRELDGVGAETADAILLYVFERPVFVVDAYARRLFGRLTGTPPSSDAELKALVEGVVTQAADLNELHALIVAHGKRFCRTQPLCASCCLRTSCQYRF